MERRTATGTVREIGRLRGHEDWIRSVGANITDDTLASGDAKSAVIAWDLPSFQRKELLVLPEYIEFNAIMALQFDHHQPSVFYTLQRSGHFTACDLRLPLIRHMHFLGHRDKPNVIRVCHNTHYIATSARSSEIKLWDMRRVASPGDESQYVRIFNKHRNERFPISFDFLLGDRCLVTGSDYFFVYVYDVLTGNVVRSVKVAPGQVAITTATGRDALSFYVTFRNGVTFGIIDTEGADIIHDFTSGDQIKEMYIQEAWEVALLRNTDNVLAAARAAQGTISTNYEQLLAAVRASDLPICKEVMQKVSTDYEAHMTAVTPRLVSDLQDFYSRTATSSAGVKEDKETHRGREETPRQVVTERVVM